MYIVADGYHQTVDDRTLEIFPIDMMQMAIEKKMDIVPDTEMVIGVFDDESITLTTHDIGSGTFKWSSKSTETNDYEQRESGCFYDIIDDLLRDKIE